MEKTLLLLMPNSTCAKGALSRCRFKENVIEKSTTAMMIDPKNIACLRFMFGCATRFRVEDLR
jgi:hypothetical protein